MTRRRGGRPDPPTVPRQEAVGGFGQHPSCNQTQTPDPIGQDIMSIDTITTTDTADLDTTDAPSAVVDIVEATQADTSPAADLADAVVAAAFPEPAQDEAQSDPATFTDENVMLTFFADNGGQRDVRLIDVVAISDGRMIADPKNPRTKIQGGVIHVNRSLNGTPKPHPIQTSEPADKIRKQAADKGRPNIPTSTAKAKSAPKPRATTPAKVAAAATAKPAATEAKAPKATATAKPAGPGRKMGTTNDVALTFVGDLFRAAPGQTMIMRDLESATAAAGHSICRHRLERLVADAGFRLSKAPRGRSAAAPAVVEVAPEPAPVVDEIAAKRSTRKAAGDKPATRRTSAKTTKS